MQLSQFDYHLPESSIAQYPTAERAASRLLRVGEKEPEEMPFHRIGTLVEPGDLLVVNSTRVIPARVLARKETGGRVEVMLERVTGAGSALVQLRSSKSVREGQKLYVEDREIVVNGRRGSFYLVETGDGRDLESLFQQHGAVPLPPYIERLPEEADHERYQTVYADTPGAVAAPTAGLHFDQALIDDLKERGVHWATITLHVGAGTYQPVRTDTIESHRMHSERVEVSQQVCDLVDKVHSRGNRVVAVGTTVVRALESAAKGGALRAFRGDTDLFITPGYQFRVVDALITNFHLPKSTLLMMVCAFGGYETVMNAYRHAIAHGLRFYSYGDAMFLQRRAA